MTTTYEIHAESVRELRSEGLSFAKIAAAVGISCTQVRRIAARLVEETPASEPEAPAKEKKKPIRISKVDEVFADLPCGQVHRFILTSAQDDTPVHQPFLDNLLAYADHLGAKLGVGGYTYQLGLFEDHAVATGVYDAALSPYLDFDRVHLTDDLLWIGDANVLPTTANPLAGWTTANRGQHVIVPHARVALESIPRMQGQPPRYAISTGTVTRPSYTPRAAGRKALFHHTYGAVIAEIDVDGECFFRHVIGDDHGSFQDLCNWVSDGVVSEAPRVAAITWGDIHYEQLNPTVARTTFGFDCSRKWTIDVDNILDWLQPEVQFMHDTLDFRRRNHHGIKDPHQRAMVRSSGSESVESEVQEAAAFINSTARPWCKTVMVESNHDAALARWLKDPEGALDAHNAYYWHALNANWHGEIRDGNLGHNIVEFAMRKAGLNDNVEFVPSGGSYVVGDVECGLHGDLGVGGSRGTPQQYRRLGPRTSSGHTHTPKIVEGVFVAGVSANLEQGYNKGPTTWAHAHIIQYRSGKRTLLLISEDGRFKAMGDVHEYRMAA
ncbi:hypothetical protein [Rhizobium leguminosarum]|uniref:hypothetical protein n=1 Tax=Rhizobium leguminosarum TaxID=384 RepID=UPI001C94506A|nr:hypothetical protein [Rhizobium leguminosarum]MBY5329591.1 hypothetical protein [Rhizobium leguminosarum]